MERIPNIIDKSWHILLQPLFNDPKMSMIRDEVLPNCSYYPEAENIFRVFNMPIDKIKVVALGQDPYPKGEAIGYAFAVKSTTKLPGSLRVIKEEIIKERVERDSYINIDSDKWRELSHWRQQGIFLLNSALTVEKGVQGSHIGVWSWFTREIIKIISVKVSPIWLLWGAKAIGNKSNIAAYRKWDGVMSNLGFVNYGLEAAHPAAELYPDSTYKFTGCGHFLACNQILKQKGQTVINW